VKSSARDIAARSQTGTRRSSGNEEEAQPAGFLFDKVRAGSSHPRQLRCPLFILQVWEPMEGVRAVGRRCEDESVIRHG
jgi:hypothetical protein